MKTGITTFVLCALCTTVAYIPATYAAETPATDSKPADIEPFTQALVSAYLNNPRLKAEREALKVSDEQVAVAASGFRPTVAAEYDKGRRRTSTNASSWFYSDAETKAAVINQPLFNGGSTLAEFKAAKQRVKQARALLLAVEQQVLLNAVTAYADVIARQSELELSRSNLQVLEKQLESTSARFKAGELTRTDEAQAQARLGTARATLRQAEANVKTAIATYIQVTGTPPASIQPPSALPPLPESLQAALEAAKTANPDMQQAYFAEKAAMQDVNAHIGDLLPDVSLQGSMERTKGSRFLGGSTQLDSDAVTINVSIPLYQSGAEYARLRAARNTKEQARYTYIQTNDSITQAVTAAYENYQASISVVESVKESVDASAIALTGVRKENEYGVRTILDVLDAEQSDFITRVNLVNAKRDSLVRAYTLLAETGGLTAENLRLPVEYYDEKDHYNNTWWIPVGF